MKTLKCSDLGGPEICTTTFSGDSMSEIGEQSKAHAMAMIATGDEAHMAAMERMKNMSPEEQQAEFQSYMQKFEAAPEV